MKLKFSEEKFFIFLMKLSLLSLVIILLSIVAIIVAKGLPSLSIEMITETPKGGFYFGKEGGILNAIIGSLYLAFLSTTAAAIISIPAALYMNVFLIKKKKLLGSIRFFLDVMWGVPSIVYGIFGFLIMVFFGLHSSLLAGIITVSLFISPILIRSADEVLQTVPNGLYESALSLGSSKTAIAFKVFTRQCIPGILTAILMAFGRAIGDAASVLFTTGYTDNIPESIFDPAASLPLSVFFQLSSPIEEVKNRAYASAVILMIIILVVSLLSRISFRKYKNKSIKY